MNSILVIFAVFCDVNLRIERLSCCSERPTYYWSIQPCSMAYHDVSALILMSPKNYQKEPKKCQLLIETHLSFRKAHRIGQFSLATYRDISAVMKLFLQFKALMVAVNHSIFVLCPCSSYDKEKIIRLDKYIR